jgi:predicted amidohydrolase
VLRPGRHVSGLSHAKALTCGTLTDPPRGKIERFAVAPVTTRLFGDVTTGALICNDLWANPACTPGPDPHLTQQSARAGACIIFHAVNGGRDGSEWSQVAWQYHESNLRMRARAGSLCFVTVDSCEPLGMPCSSPSGVINPRGEWMVRTAPCGEELFVSDIDLES